MPDRQLSSSQRKTDFISLPDSFFTQAVPKIQDLAELKIVLYVAYLILRKQERPYFVTYKELLSHELIATIGEETLRQALGSAVEHGALLHSTLNRSWRYIARILERWASEGKDSGKYKRDIKKDDPDKYIKGKYGHLVQR